MKGISSLTISVLILLCIFLITSSISAAISATRVGLRGQIANETDELGNDTLTLMPTLTAGVPGRTIAERNLSTAQEAMPDSSRSWKKDLTETLPLQQQQDLRGSAPAI
ncbi:MAG TPA: hypothetical protein VIO58_03430 [Candidatus Methanoperedens sp.]